VFWTNFVPNHSVEHEDGDFENGARMEVNRLALFDYFNLNNALNDGTSVPATASYEVRWTEDGSPLTIDDGANFHFRGRRTKGSISWSAHEAGFSFKSLKTTHTNFALVGHERNGVFYNSI
jgi:hypothetical protein